MSRWRLLLSLLGFEREIPPPPRVPSEHPFPLTQRRPPPTAPHQSGEHRIERSTLIPPAPKG